MRLLLLFACAAVAGCTSPAPPVTTSDIPLPPFAAAGTFNGGFETRIDLTARRIRDHLASAYGPLEIAESGSFSPLAAGAGWPEVEAFYDSTFGQPPLDGFVREPVESPDPERYQLALWSNGTDVLGVAVVAGRPDDPLPFLLRFRTQPE